MKLFVLVIGVCVVICIARYVYGVARYVYGVARYENDIQCKVLEIYNNLILVCNLTLGSDLVLSQDPFQDQISFLYQTERSELILISNLL